MKKANVKYPHGQGVHEAIILRDYVDLMEYFGILNEKSMIMLKRLLRSGVSPDKFSHLLPKTPEGNLMCHTLISCNLKSASPILEYSNTLSKLEMSMIKNLPENGFLVVNKMGGFFSSTDDSIIESEWDEDGEHKNDYVHIVPGCGFINLENDPDLEQSTIDFMDSVGYNGQEKFSYITNFHVYNVKELTDIFNKFKSSGGHTVYVYTTGLNVTQMYDYLEAAIISEIPNMIIDFNSEITPEIKKFADFATNSQINFKSNV